MAERLDRYVAFAKTKLEKIELLTHSARIHIAANRYPDAMETCYRAVRLCGFDPFVGPSGPDSRLPAVPSDCDLNKLLPGLEAYKRGDLSEDEKIIVALTTLIAYGERVIPLSDDT